MNNTLSTTFTAAPLYGSPVTVRLRTRAGTSGLLRLESIRGPILIERTWDGTRDSLFTETAELTSGSYIVTLVDSGGTNASARIIAADGGVIKVLHSAPKGGTVHQFRVDVGAVSEVEAITDAELLLLPGRGHAMVDVHAAEKVSVVVKDGTGSPVWERHVPEKKPSSYPIDLSAQPTGSYEVILVRKGEETSLGRIDLFDNGPR
ncbi:MAG TPA: hypothetical protein PK760_00685 [Flavobacteriales bacterium]|nr:hypothetical protein [Flavobacteriales bacterium]